MTGKLCKCHDCTFFFETGGDEAPTGNNSKVRKVPQEQKKTKSTEVQETKKKMKKIRTKRGLQQILGHKSKMLARNSSLRRRPGKRGSAHWWNLSSNIIKVELIVWT